MHVPDRVLSIPVVLVVFGAMCSRISENSVKDIDYFPEISFHLLVMVFAVGSGFFDEDFGANVTSELRGNSKSA